MNRDSSTSSSVQLASSIGSTESTSSSMPEATVDATDGIISTNSVSITTKDSVSTTTATSTPELLMVPSVALVTSSSASSAGLCFFLVSVLLTISILKAVSYPRWVIPVIIGTSAIAVVSLIVAIAAIIAYLRARQRQTPQRHSSMDTNPLANRVPTRYRNLAGTPVGIVNADGQGENYDGNGESGLRLLDHADVSGNSYGSRGSAGQVGERDVVGGVVYRYSYGSQASGRSSGDVYQLGGGYTDAMRERKRAEQLEEMHRAYENYTRTKLGGVGGIPGASSSASAGAGAGAVEGE
ncbi:hypothetical protein HDU82_006160 [Entophlyctis luteolus]|nr:hypothetical protein HDU82_006160 [Entophlyctis luteolus]